MHPIHSSDPRRGALLLAALLLAGAGCTGGDAKVKIHGKVTLDGVPVKTGAVNFRPTDGKTSTAGGPIKDGEYTADVPPGRMRVEITAPKVVGKRKLFDTPNSPTADKIEELIPPQYNVNSQLTRDIKADQPEVDFELTSKKK